MLDIKNFIPKTNEPLVIGCSAGPDSMALLHYLKHNTTNPLICCHINHNVRKESIKEQNYLKEYCKKENITFECYKIEKYQENNFENEARQKRYAFYEETLKKYHSQYLFLAHHGDDLIETVLMKISRGSNLEGYAGIKEISKRKDYFLIRPFLSYTKKDLQEYNEFHNIQYFIDSSNENTIYTRNRIRKNILPLLKEENSNIHLQFLKFSQTLLEYNTYLEEQLNMILPTMYQDNILNINALKQQHPFLQKNILYKILNNIYHNQTNIITQTHIQNILSLIQNKTPNLSLNLPQNKQVIKEYNNLYIKDAPKTKTPPTYKIPLQNKNILGSIIIQKINPTKENGNDICKIDSQKIKLPLYIRNKKPGDSITLLSSNHHKKLSDIFIEKKIPKEKRNTYPILVDSADQIIWIPNLKKSKFNSQNNEFYDIILRYCEKEENDEQ